MDTLLCGLDGAATCLGFELDQFAVERLTMANLVGDEGCIVSELIEGLFQSKKLGPMMGTLLSGLELVPQRFRLVEQRVEGVEEVLEARVVSAILAGHGGSGCGAWCVG